MAWAAEVSGIHAILGAFVAGLFIDTSIMTSKASREVQSRLATVSVGTLAPIFFVTAGFEVSLEVFRTDLSLLVLVIVVATVGKIVGTALFYLLSGNGWREGIILGTGMNGRGAVEIIVAEIALAQGLIDSQVFSILVFMAIFTTATVPVLLTIGVKWLRGRGELVKAGDRTTTMIVGAGPLARTLGAILQATAPVLLIDTNRANQIAGERKGLKVIAGSGFEETTLNDAGIDRASRFIAATPNAEVNLLSAQLAVDLGVPEVMVLLREADAASFRSQLENSSIEVIKAPNSLQDWEHALLVGATELMTVPAGVEDESLGNGQPDGQLFPIVVIGTNDTYPITTQTVFTDTDELMLLARSQTPRVSKGAVPPTR
jgi:hypothetical protein